ncbi:MAG: CoA transferase [Betaproteobacteria bacterium]|nr:CoA transferase [Betaproteobacteria bacterium]
MSQSASAPGKAGALAGIRVVDFTQAIVGPTATMLLADFGADVIKVEPPGGDSSRRWGENRYGDKGQYSGPYLSINRNKRSIVLDLKSASGLEVAKRLVAGADVFMENYRPGVMPRLGLGYEAMAAINPRLVYCSISGFGQTGPESHRPGYDQLLQAYAGLLSVTGEQGRPAVRIGPMSIDILTGAHSVIGILAALRERDRSGLGQYIDAALYETALHLVTQYICDYTISGVAPRRTGPFLQFLAPYGNFQASDREIFMGCGTQKNWEQLCAEIGRSDLTKLPEFASIGLRAKNQTALYEILLPIFRSKPAAYWCDVCERLGIPYSVINDISDVVQNKQAKARDALVGIAGMEGLLTAGPPVKLSRTPATVRTPPPDIGADANDILRELGFDAAQIEKLRAEGGIA